ncbi:MAG: lysophospholipid acyltransferase family protein [Candidatus Dormibacteraeota bacterium]|nr:lysophospholipid acyltransferase family protein [Candidatus Dormibacteraeota bacterium]
MRALPPGPRYAAWALGGSAWYTLSRGQRRAALTNYAAVLALPEDDPRVARTARAAFRNYGKMLADFLFIAALSPEELPGALSVEGEEHAWRAVRAGTGGILALPHMGSWDFAGGLGSMLGFPLSAVAEAFPGSLNDAVVEGRRRLGLNVIPVGRGAVRAIYRSLDAGGLVALLCDLPPPGGGGVEVEFFGRRALVPAGPAAIALKRGVPLIPVFSRRDAADHYHVHVDPPVPPPAGARGDASAAFMQGVVRRFENFISAYPEQWYAFKRVLR